MYYVLLEWSGGVVERVLQVAWREAQGGGEWNVFNWEDAPISGIWDLKPATDYEVKARQRLLEYDDDYRPWSKTYTVRTSDVPDPQPCTPETGKLRNDIQGLSISFNYRWGPVVLENPDKNEWDYVFRVSRTGSSSYVRMSINQDGKWTLEVKRGWNDPTITSGQISNLEKDMGARNRFVFDTFKFNNTSKQYEFKFYVNDKSVPIEVPDYVVRDLRDGRRHYLRITSTEWTEYERYPNCRHWWHYW